MTRPAGILLLFLLVQFVVVDQASAQVREAWVARYDGPASDWDYLTALAVDLDGAVYVTGESDDTDSRRDFATLKYDPHGNLLWIARFTEDHRYSAAEALALDNGGNVYVTGYSAGDYATVKYDSGGNEIWSSAYDGPANWDRAIGIVVDDERYVYVTGFSGPRAGRDTDYATVKYRR